jgi:hypothetical protein
VSAEAILASFVLVTADDRAQAGMGEDPRGAAGAGGGCRCLARPAVRRRGTAAGPDRPTRPPTRAPRIDGNATSRSGSRQAGTTVPPSAWTRPPGDGGAIQGHHGGSLEVGDAEDLVGLIGLPAGLRRADTPAARQPPIHLAHPLTSASSNPPRRRPQADQASRGALPSLMRQIAPLPVNHVGMRVENMDAAAIAWCRAVLGFARPTGRPVAGQAASAHPSP